ncbi:hypothetical protein LTR56_002490 [Elasticomyces elasticus]|nr:hypothetical protein LTR22_012107 [Elasticomyces elasticus]KAK3657348.1 hypothetical protein LTR56_002490 [Elasticomyces elasticus]KAK5754788.1 hypothetical protein LTS12_015105 [Elasticomyces elasticus]
MDGPRVHPMREVRSMFNLFGRRSKSRSKLVFPAPKEPQTPSISTQDALEQEISQELMGPPLPNESQMRQDREAVKAENAKVYARDLNFDGEIRLLRIQPGSGPLFASLEYASLDSAPAYDALSYCWGAQQQMEPVTIDDKDDFRLSRHLHSAMLRLRRPDRVRLIWIDVICVNQANIAERNRSVQLMWKIYANAHRVIVWVGETEPEAPTCKRLFAGESHHETQLVWCTQPGLAALEHDHVTKKLGDTLQTLEWQSATNGGDVWWKRLWVIQEFSRAKHHPTVYVGPHAISWAFFAQLMRTESHDRLPLFHHLRTREEQSLLQLLFMAKDFYCSDPRDRIYALLGLVKGGQTTILPDYSEAVPRVYEDATLYLIQSEGNLDVLLDGRLERDGGGYPTWVPHFTQLRDRALVRSKDGYEAGLGEPSVSLVPAMRSNSLHLGCAACHSATGRALRLKAVPFGGIASRSTENTLPAPDSTHRTILTRHGQIQKAELSRPLQTLEQVLDELKVDFKKEPTLPLDRSTGIGYLILDYMFGGIRSAVDEYTRIDHIRFEDAAKQRARREMDRLAAKFGIHLTAARKLDMTLTAVWENAFLTVRHKAIYTPDGDTRRLLLGDHQEMYHVPAKLRRRDFFATAEGFIGMGPAMLEVGDEVVVPFGASRPFIIRSHGDHHVLIGDAVVPGIMSGQLVNLCNEGSMQTKDYLLR